MRARVARALAGTERSRQLTSVATYTYITTRASGVQVNNEPGALELEENNGTMFVALAVLAGALLFYVFFVAKRPKDYPPGPMFRLPLIGQGLYLGGDQMAGYERLRKKYEYQSQSTDQGNDQGLHSPRYGPIFSLELGPFNGVAVADLDVLEEMFAGDEFNHRGDISELFGNNFMARLSRVFVLFIS